MPDIQTFETTMASFEIVTILCETTAEAIIVVQKLLEYAIPLDQISVLESALHGGYKEKHHLLFSLFAVSKSLVLEKIGPIYAAGFIANELFDPGLEHGYPENPLTDALGRVGISTVDSDRFARALKSGKTLLLAFIRQEALTTVRAAISLVNTGIIRINSRGHLTVKETSEFLAALDTAYNGLIFIGTLGSQTMLEITRESITTRSGELIGQIENFILPSERPILKSAQFSSPGFWEFLGKLNPLEILRLYLQDRHERAKDKQYRDTKDEMRLELENQLLANRVIRERLEIGRSVGLTNRELMPLMNEVLLRPMRALATYQDEGLIDIIELSATNQK